MPKMLNFNRADYLCDHFDPNGIPLGKMNIYSSRDLVMHLRENNLIGYYIESHGDKISLNENDKTYTPYDPYQAHLNRIEQKYT